jgi:hypothetical protein
MTHLEVARLLLSTASTLHSHMVQQQAAGVAPLAALRCNGLSKRILDTLQTPIAKDEQVGCLSGRVGFFLEYELGLKCRVADSCTSPVMSLRCSSFCAGM